MIFENRTPIDRFFLVLKGIAMGAANKVPGVSGGIVAIAAGFYEEFIYSLKKINQKALKLLISCRFSLFYNYINGRFLGLLFLGMIISYFSVSKLLDFALEKHETLVWGVFFGMILGSALCLIKYFEKWNYTNIVWSFLGFSFGVAISMLNPATGNDHLGFVFFCGVISITGMTLPGLSGSFLLMLLGNYVLLLVDAVNAVYDSLKDLFTGNISQIFHPDRKRLLVVMAVFSLGSLTGLVIFSHILSYVLERFKLQTNALLIGFVMGSLGMVWPWKKTVYLKGLDGEFRLDSSGKLIVEKFSRYWPDLASQQNWWVVLAILVGLFIVIGLYEYGKSK